MPSFVITSSAHTVGKTINARLCPPGPSGYADERSAVPVKATISERTLRIDDEPRPRSIISCTGVNGIHISSTAARNRSPMPRAALRWLRPAQLQQLTRTLRPLQAQSEQPELAFEGLGLLFNWFADERERLTEGSAQWLRQ